VGQTSAPQRRIRLAGGGRIRTGHLVVSWLRGITTVERGCREASDKRMSGFSAERPSRRNYSAERLIGRIASVFEIVPALLHALPKVNRIRLAHPGWLPYPASILNPASASLGIPFRFLFLARGSREIWRRADEILAGRA
jgi:hypothetical protein